MGAETARDSPLLGCSAFWGLYFQVAFLLKNLFTPSRVSGQNSETSSHGETSSFRDCPRALSVF